MSTEIVHINITEHESTQVVDARELHAKLGVGRDYRHWIADRLDAVGAEENQGFWVVAKSAQNSSGGRPAVNHIVSLDVAEHLCMLERTPAGHKYRQFMIGCRKQLAATPAPNTDIAGLFDNPETLLRLAVEGVKKVQVLQAQLALVAPKAEILDRLTLAEGVHSMNDVAKELGIGLRSLFGFMKERGILLKVNNTPYQKHIDAGRFIVRMGTFKKNGRDETYARTYATAKGVVYLRELLDLGSQLAAF